jgi:uncharacterized protein
MAMKSFKIKISDSIGSVSAQLLEPKKPKALIVLAHGAGAGMNHRFMIALSAELAALGSATLRYNFPYMENGKKRPDVPAVATKTVEMVLAKAHELYPKIKVFAAGKSFGGRMSSQYLAKSNPEFVNGIIFYGFPLHPAGAPSIERADHLKTVSAPMLFLQGTRDALADLALIKKTVKSLSTTTLELFEGADHSFKSGKKEFIPELAVATENWIKSL